MTIILCSPKGRFKKSGSRKCGKNEADMGCRRQGVLFVWRKALQPTFPETVIQGTTTIIPCRLRGCLVGSRPYLPTSEEHFTRPTIGTASLKRRCVNMPCSSRYLFCTCTVLVYASDRLFSDGAGAVWNGVNFASIDRACCTAFLCIGLCSDSH